MTGLLERIYTVVIMMLWMEFAGVGSFGRFLCSHTEVE